MSKKKNWLIISAAIIVAAGLLAGTLIWLHKQGPEKAPAFLPGVYACSTQNEFCQIDDTLTIRRTQMGQDNYTVTRTTSFIRVRQGRRDLPEFQQQRWEAKYQGNLLMIPSNGTDTVWYFPDMNKVSKANFMYEKIE